MFTANENIDFLLKKEVFHAKMFNQDPNYFNYLLLIIFISSAAFLANSIIDYCIGIMCQGFDSRGGRGGFDKKTSEAVLM